MILKPPPQQIPGAWALTFIASLLETVRLNFEALRILDIDYVTGYTAGTTQTQAGATALTGTINNVGTVANASDGVKLPTAKQNTIIEVLNTGANAAQVWPNTADTIDGGSANAVDSNTLGTASSRRYFAVDDISWITLSDG